jgi:hypothetical protein
VNGFGGDFQVIARMQPHEVAISAKSCPRGHEIANARLIAAAPELLALVERYASECGECGGTGRALVYGPVSAPGESRDCEDCADIRAALAKVAP